MVARILERHLNHPSARQSPTLRRGQEGLGADRVHEPDALQAWNGRDQAQRFRLGEGHVGDEDEVGERAGRLVGVGECERGRRSIGVLVVGANADELLEGEGGREEGEVHVGIVEGGEEEAQVGEGLREVVFGVMGNVRRSETEAQVGKRGGEGDEGTLVENVIKAKAKVGEVHQVLKMELGSRGPGDVMSVEVKRAKRWRESVEVMLALVDPLDGELQVQEIRERLEGKRVACKKNQGNRVEAAREGGTRGEREKVHPSCG